VNTYKVTITGYQMAEDAGAAKSAYIKALTGKSYLSDDKGSVHTLEVHDEMPIVAWQPFVSTDHYALTLRELQAQLPWTTHYHRDFRANPQPHKDFQHAMLHVQKALGKLASVVNQAEHGGADFAAPLGVDPYVADLVVCALRMANTCPGRTIDLQRAVQDRINSKNEVKLS